MLLMADENNVSVKLSCVVLFELLAAGVRFGTAFNKCDKTFFYYSLLKEMCIRVR